MPKVLCGWVGCAYNKDRHCRARSIVLDEDLGDLYCETFTKEIWKKKSRRAIRKEREAYIREKDEEAKAVSDKIRDALLARMGEGEK